MGCQGEAQDGMMDLRKSTYCKRQMLHSDIYGQSTGESLRDPKNG